MLEIKDKSKCCGCEACSNICPKKCLSFSYDEEGFRYPVIDKTKCIDCNLCQKVCPIINTQVNKDLSEETYYYAGYNKNDIILKDSSSGGIFWLLVEWTIKNKGIVYGVELTDGNDVHYNRADNIKSAEVFRKSKYLQAKVGQIYNMVKDDLKNNKIVLFSGTPCQIAALYSFLGKEYENLYTIDVVCHGVPSRKVFDKYIEYVEKKHQSLVKKVIFRDKIKGWGPNRVTLLFEDGTTQTSTSKENPFQTGFLKNIYLRPSCYSCKYAKIPRIADLSLADFWGYTGELLEENDNKGLSAIIVSTNKGKLLFDEIKEKIIYHEVTQDYLTTRSRHVYIHPEGNRKRAKFFKELDKNDFEYLMNNYIMKDDSLGDKVQRKAMKVFRKIVKKNRKR